MSFFSSVKAILLVPTLKFLGSFLCLILLLILPDKFQSQLWLLLLSDPQIQIEDGLV